MNEHVQKQLETIKNAKLEAAIQQVAGSDGRPMLLVVATRYSVHDPTLAEPILVLGSSVKNLNHARDELEEHLVIIAVAKLQEIVGSEDAWEKILQDASTLNVMIEASNPHES